MVEWFKALVLKTSEVQASVGSNPTLSATITPRLYRRVFLLQVQHGLFCLRRKRT